MPAQVNSATLPTVKPVGDRGSIPVQLIGSAVGGGSVGGGSVGGGSVGGGVVGGGSVGGGAVLVLQLSAYLLEI